MDAAPIKNGYVTIDDEGKILEIGKIEKECESTEFYNGILIPGMVNSHCHIELSHLVNLFRQNTGMAGFIAQINELRCNCDRDGRIKALEAEMDNLYNQGVQAMADISNCDESFEKKASSPMYTRSFLEVFGTEPNDAPAIVAGALQLMEKAHAMGIDAAPTPHACYTSSRELIGSVSKEGIDRGFVSYHSEESWEENAMIKTGTGPLADDYHRRKMSTPEVCGCNSLIYYIDTLRKIYGDSIPGHILLVHNTYTDKDSIDYALKYMQHPYWALCPKSNIFIHRALPPIELMRSKHLKMTIGTDSLSSNTSLDMIDEVRCLQEHFPQIPLEELLQYATLNGAEFLKKDDLFGSLTPGKKPGLILVDHIDWENMKLTPQSKTTRLI